MQQVATIYFQLYALVMRRLQAFRRAVPQLAFLAVALYCISGESLFCILHCHWFSPASHATQHAEVSHAGHVFEIDCAADFGHHHEGDGLPITVLHDLMPLLAVAIEQPRPTTWLVQPELLTVAQYQPIPQTPPPML
jgi:hypothetical protein